MNTMADNPKFAAVAKGLLALHQLFQCGRGDSDAADAIRDALDAPSAALGPLENERARWLSEDLYSISEPDDAGALQAMTPEAQQQLIESLEARKVGELDRALDLLRAIRKYVSPPLLSYQRGAIWMQAGVPEVAAEFFNHARSLDPKNANYHALYLDALEKSDPVHAAGLADEILKQARKYSPVVVAQAAEIWLKARPATPDVQGTQNYARMIPILVNNLDRAEKDQPIARAALQATIGLLGFCYQSVGNVGEAVRWYTRGIQTDPGNAVWLAARGILQYGVTPYAINDLKRAVALKVPLIWPYLFLAHHYLTSKQFDLCRHTCEAAIELRGSDAAKSQLEEWRAIAQAELGFPPEAVRTAFESALQFDPSDEFAQRNQIIFEAFLAKSPAGRRPEWEFRSEASLRQSVLAERRFLLAA